MLKAFYPYEYAQDVFEIDYEALYENGITALIFDIDNTLVHHGDDSTPKVDALFEKLHSIGFKTLLLSNNGEDRVKRFIKNIDTPYICNANKPRPAKYKKALKMLGVKNKNAVVIGDQIFIDILGANLAKIPSVLVHFIIADGETYFGKRRELEAKILAKYSKSKHQHRLGSIILKEQKENAV